MWGFGVISETNVFEICTADCQAGISGEGDGQFNQPAGIAVDSAGNVYVTDSFNFRIQKFDSSGNFLRMWGFGVSTGAAEFEICTADCQAGISGGGNGQFSMPAGLSVDSAGNVYVTDRTNHRVQKFDSNGTF
jgi:DNA-binding beta-propeller fold protein YncE